MTESLWVGGVLVGGRVVTEMLESVRGKTSDRKSRLFTCSCCRRLWAKMTDERSREGVDIAEQFADGTISEDLLKTEWINAYQAWSESVATGETKRTRQVLNLARLATQQQAAVQDEGVPLDERVRVSLLRDIFGNPFRPVSINPIWRTPTVSDLAQAAYDERALPSGELDPARLAVLSDALEEAGCDEPDILAHLRSPGPHVRGCWVLDLLLGKE